VNKLKLFLSAVFFVYQLNSVVVAFAEAEPEQKTAEEKIPDAVQLIFSEQLDDPKELRADPEKEKKRRELRDSLLAALDSKDEETRFLASLGLERIVSRGDMPLLVRKLKEKSTDEVIQQALISAIGSTKDIGSFESLQFEFRMGKPKVKLAIAEALGKLNDESVIPFLAQILVSGESPELSKRAAISIAQIGGEQAFYALESAKTFFQDPTSQITLNYALKAARGELSFDKTDQEIGLGRKLKLTFQGMPYYFYIPARAKTDTSKSWLLVCIHDQDLLFEEIFELCSPIAKQYKLALLVPFFDPIRFPEYGEFNLKGLRSDRMLNRLIDFLGSKLPLKSREFYLYGYGKGGDFAHRYQLAYPTKLARAAFYPSDVMVGKTDVLFPNGLKSSPLAPDLKFNLEEVVKSDFAIIQDINTSAKKSYKAFYRMLTEFADEHDIISRVRIRQLPEQQSNPTSTWTNAVQYLFPSY
jgi:hypothetical protein